MLNIIKQYIIKRSLGTIIPPAMYNQPPHWVKVLHLVGEPWLRRNPLLLRVYKFRVQRITNFKEFQCVAGSSVSILPTKDEDVDRFLHEALVVVLLCGCLLPEGFFCEWYYSLGDNAH